MNRYVMGWLVCAACLCAPGCSESEPSGGSDDAGADAHDTNDASTHDDASPDATHEEDGGADASTEDDGGLDTDAEVPDGGGDPVTPSAAGQLVITEIHADPAGFVSSDHAEWIEIHNPSGSVTYNLRGCVFSDKPGDDDFMFGTDIIVAPGGYITLSSAPFTVETNGFVSEASYGTSGTGLSSGGDAPTIKCGGTVIDTVAYPALLAEMEGHTLQLDPGSLDAVANDLPASWCYSLVGYVVVPTSSTTNFGSPRAMNVACVEVGP